MIIVKEDEFSEVMYFIKENNYDIIKKNLNKEKK